MRKHIHKVINHHIEVVLRQIIKVFNQRLALILANNFVITKLYLHSVSFQLLAQKVLLVLVESLLATLNIFVVHPPLRKLLFDFAGHQTRKNSVAGVAGGGWQNGVVIRFFLDRKIVGKQTFHYFPLVVPKIVDENKIQRVFGFEQRKNHPLHQLVRQHGLVRFGVIEPVFVVFFDKLTKVSVGLVFLHIKNLAHAAVLGIFEFQLPVSQFFIYFCPFLMPHAVLVLHGQLPELLLVA